MPPKTAVSGVPAVCPAFFHATSAVVFVSNQFDVDVSQVPVPPLPEPLATGSQFKVSADATPGASNGPNAPATAAHNTARFFNARTNDLLPIFFDSEKCKPTPAAVRERMAQCGGRRRPIPKIH